MPCISLETVLVIEVMVPVGGMCFSMACHVGGVLVCALWNRSHEHGASHVMLRPVIFTSSPLSGKGGKKVGWLIILLY